MAVSTWNPAHPSELQVDCIEVEQPATEASGIVATLAPSVVSLSNGKVYVGEGAKRLLAHAPARGMRRKRDFFLETKNEMGTDRIYPEAPEGFRSPGEIGGRVLSFLMMATSGAPDATVVTVPASFQAAQRRETIAAAAHAGFDLLHSHLMDEPLAAFIDFIAKSGPFGHPSPRRMQYPGVRLRRRNLRYRNSFALRESRWRIKGSSADISRFHRLGGGDIDAAIVYDMLIPQLSKQNALPRQGLGFREKRHLEPALRLIAESLKEEICQELSRRARP